MGTNKNSAPIFARAATILAMVYSLVLFILGMALLYSYLADSQNNVFSYSGKGMVDVIILSFAGSFYLIYGSYKLLKQRNPTLVATPLFVLFCIGCIGQVADAVGTATIQSDLIGGLILLAAILPVLLLLAPSSRKWTGKSPVNLSLIQRLFVINQR